MSRLNYLQGSGLALQTLTMMMKKGENKCEH